MRILILSNPGARDNRDHARTGDLCRRLMAGGARLEIVSLKDEQAVKSCLSSRSITKWDRIVAIGGDGTLSRMAQTLIHRKEAPPLAIYPGGTVNDFASSQNIPRDVELFCSSVIQGNLQNVDLGLCQDRYFINVLSAGHFTDAAFTVNPRAKSILGPAAYYIEGMKRFSEDELTPFRMKWECDQGKGDEEVMALVVANGPSVAGFKGLVPQGAYNDGLLDVLIIRACDTVDLIALFLVAMSRSHLDDYRVVHLRTSSISLEPQRPLAFTADGEEGGTLPGVVELKRGALRMIDFRNNPTG